MTYPIGEKGKAWGTTEKQTWLKQQSIKRSYVEQVVSEINKIKQMDSLNVDVVEYGQLEYDNANYVLYAICSSNWNPQQPTVLVTGGVHGYETSGVHGALRFITDKLSHYTSQFNFVVAPCVSPWGYETINRWNPDAIDPNRSFYQNSPAQESALLMAYLLENNIQPICHMDLHETTDTDNSEFRPALAARDAVEQKSWNIPDGFYGVGDTNRPEPDFQRAIIASVESVTHIAPSDENNELIGVPLEQKGVINYACKPLGLCAGMTDAQYVSTTEVYPDSPKVDDENCIQAQVAAITGAIEYLIMNK